MLCHRDKDVILLSNLAWAHLLRAMGKWKVWIVAAVLFPGEWIWTELAISAVFFPFFAYHSSVARCVGIVGEKKLSPLLS